MAIKKQAADLHPPPSKRQRSNPLQLFGVLGHGFTTDMQQHYELGHELGRGQFGTIRHCTSRTTGRSFACKSIPKSKIRSSTDAEDVKMEIQIMKRLSGHPGIVGLESVFEDSLHVHMIMELCEGGDLFDGIVKRNAFPESEAAQMFKSLVEVVKYCHDMGIMHRDLKPENILLTSSSPSSSIKVADFGLALPFRPGNESFFGATSSCKFRFGYKNGAKHRGKMCAFSMAAYLYHKDEGF